MSPSTRHRSYIYPINSIPLALLLAAGLTASPAFCGGAEEAGIQPGVGMPAKAQPNQTNGAAGLRAFIDPNTKKLRAPTAEENRQLGQQRRTETPAGEAGTGQEAPVEKVHPSGAVSVEVGESGMSYAVAKRNPDGSVSTKCDTESKSAEQALNKMQQSGTAVHKETDHDR
jgi:hypothetical protein